MVCRRLLPLLLLMLSVGACALAGGEYADISHQDLLALVKSHQVVLLDCNGSKFYADHGHLPGAIDFQGAKSDLAKLLPANKYALVVSYCMNHH